MEPILRPSEVSQKSRGRRELAVVLQAGRLDLFKSWSVQEPPSSCSSVCVRGSNQTLLLLKVPENDLSERAA